MRENTLSEKLKMYVVKKLLMNIAITKIIYKFVFMTFSTDQYDYVLFQVPYQMRT